MPDLNKRAGIQSGSTILNGMAWVSQTDILILSGQGEEEFMAKFNYKGFRYVEVTASKPVVLTKNSLTAYYPLEYIPVLWRLKAFRRLL